MVIERIRKALGMSTDIEETPTVSVNDLNPHSLKGRARPAMLNSMGSTPSQDSLWNGEKYFEGMGPVPIQWTDYWAIRQRSAELFNTNLYAKGLIRRLVNNEINKGLSPEAIPEPTIIGKTEEWVNEWSEDVETRFSLWANDPEICDFYKKDNFAQLQYNIRLESLIEGDILVVLRYPRGAKTPSVQLIRGGHVQTPFGGQGARKGHTIKYGVEFDSKKRQVAYWVKQADSTECKRIPAYGEKSGRRISWLVYGTEKRIDDIRGQSLLAIIMQSAKEVDRYRDSVQRKATINSTIAGFIKKTEDKPGTLPMQGGAVKKNTATVTDSDGSTRDYKYINNEPGRWFEELQQGEEPVPFNIQGTDLNFPSFEKSIVAGIAWANNVPPEILMLAFSNNYSASQAAINEFKSYLNWVWSVFGAAVNTPVYKEWLISEVLIDKIDAPGLLESWRDRRKYDIFNAWVLVEWYGNVKPSTDKLKDAKGSKLLVDNAWSTNAREARGLTGTKFSKNAARLVRENELKAAAIKPILELHKEYGEEQVNKVMNAMNTLNDNEGIIQQVEELINGK